MSAVVEYRLVNKLEQQFVWETLMLMGVGIVLIVFFGTVLLKALSSSISSEYQHLRDRREQELNDAGSSGAQHDGGSRDVNYLDASLGDWQNFGGTDVLSVNS